jgi:hypothetical protein
MVLSPPSCKFGFWWKLEHVDALLKLIPIACRGQLTRLAYLGIMMPFGWNTTTLTGTIPTELYVAITLVVNMQAHFSN